MATPHNPGGSVPIYSRMIEKYELQREKNIYMESCHATNFKQFRKLPRLHIAAAHILKGVEGGINMQKRIAKKARLCAHRESDQNTIKLITRWSAYHKKEIEYILKKVPIMSDCPFFYWYTLKVLVGLLLFGHQSLPLGTMETTNLLYYEEDMKEALLETATIFGGMYVSELPIYVRINTLSISIEQCVNAFCTEGWDLLQRPESYKEYLEVVSNLKDREFVKDFHISELLVFPPGTSFYEHPGYLKGKFVLQDKGSCLASFLLNPKPGSRVYDMCAAPGKSTNHLANIMNNEGLIYAVDNHPHRYNKLYSFLKLTNSSCAQTILANNMDIGVDNLNYILLDVSSTFSGVSYERPREGMGRRLKQYYNSSIKTLTYVLQTFTTVKRVVFSSCTRFPEEGEKVVRFVLSTVGNSYDLLDVKELLWNQWFSVGETETNCGSFPFADKCLRTNPTIDKCHGYFIAVFERNFEVPVPPYSWRMKASNGTIDFSDGELDDETPDISNEKVSNHEPFRKLNLKVNPGKMKINKVLKRIVKRSRKPRRKSQKQTQPPQMSQPLPQTQPQPQPQLQPESEPK